jgi:hypothetical protein
MEKWVRKFIAEQERAERDTYIYRLLHLVPMNPFQAWAQAQAKEWMEETA